MGHAIRQLLKAPSFTCLAILTLALGIGLNTSMFSVMNLLLLQPLPFAEKQTLVRIYRTTPQSDTAGFTAPDYLELKQALRDARVATYRLWSMSLGYGDRVPVNLNALRVSGDFFPALGLKPELGRYFTTEDDKPGTHVIVLSHATWQSQFGGDPAVIGRTVRIDGEPTTIIGVMPAEFSSLFLWGPGDAFRPFALTARERVDKTDSGLAVLARLNPGASLAQFNGQLASVAEQLAKNRPREQSRDGLRALTLEASAQTPMMVSFSWLLVAVAAFVLLIACANLANLQLARTIARAQEFAIRSALGASRLRLLQPVLTESLLLSVAGGGLGILVANWANAWMSHRISSNGVIHLAVTVDWRVLAFTIAVSVVTGVAFGLVPAFLLSHIRVNDALKTGTRGNTGGKLQSRVRHALIVGQFALTLVLLATAGLYVRAFERMLARDTGWDRRDLLHATVSLPAAKYSTLEEFQSFYDRAQQRLAAVPGVENVTVGWTLPIIQFLSTRNYIVEGRDPPPAGREPVAFVNGIGPSYLATLKIKLLAGRNFTATDTLRSPPVVIINESMARALFGHESPLGHRLGSTDPAKREWAEIVGVVPDIRLAVSLGMPATRFLVFKPLAQDPWGYVAIAVRSAHASTLTGTFRRTIAEIDPDLPLQQFGTIDELVRGIGGASFTMIGTVLSGFSLLGLFLSAVGLYGVIMRLVAQRLPELGVRVALGARQRDVVWLILRMGIVLAGIGTVIGLVGSFGVARLMANLTPDLPVQDPLIILGVAALLLAVALLASWIPAHKAARVDPLIALRAE